MTRADEWDRREKGDTRIMTGLMAAIGIYFAGLLTGIILESVIP